MTDGRDGVLKQSWTNTALKSSWVPWNLQHSDFNLNTPIDSSCSEGTKEQEAPCSAGILHPQSSMVAKHPVLPVIAALCIKEPCTYCFPPRDLEQAYQEMSLLFHTGKTKP